MTPQPEAKERLAQARRDLKNRAENDFVYHAPFGSQVARYGEIRAKIKELACFIIDGTPVSREQSLALTNLEQAMFWANAAIARNEFPPSEIEEEEADPEG